VTTFRVFLLTTLILLSASRLPGQAYGRPTTDTYIQPVVCNDGTSSFYVAHAYVHIWLGKDPWVIQGWYEVKPGKCTTIGPDRQHYASNKNILGVGDDGVALLAFAFFDSKGVWAAAKVPVGGAYESSNQQFCVKDGDTFEYALKGEQSDLSRQCQAGYHLISASVAFYGYSFHPDDPGPRDYLHVKLGPSDRAIPLGPQTASGGAARKTVTPGGGSSAATVGTRNSTTAEAGDADALRLKQYPACNVITRVEAEGVLGVSVDPPEPGRALCRYQEPGYGTDSSKRKQVTIGIWRSTAASPEDVNNRRNAIIKDKSLLPVSYKELPDFGDAALWVWAGGYYGALYVYRGGTVEVAVKISGVAENVALSTAKTFAARALGGVSKTGYVYAARKD